MKRKVSNIKLMSTPVLYKILVEFLAVRHCLSWSVRYSKSWNASLAIVLLDCRNVGGMSSSIC